MFPLVLVHFNGFNSNGLRNGCAGFNGSSSNGSISNGSIRSNDSADSNGSTLDHAYKIICLYSASYTNYAYVYIFLSVTVAYILLLHT